MILARAVRNIIYFLIILPFQWFIPSEILRTIFAITAADIKLIFNGARDIKNKAGLIDKARQSSPDTSVAIAMCVSLCSIRKNQTL